MTESNRLRMTWVDQTDPNVIPPTPRMRAVRLTGESLVFKPNFTSSDELRDDRMRPDPIKVGEENSGGVNTEWSFPVDLSPASSMVASLFANAWSNTPVRDNDGAADSVITGIVASTGVVTVLTGAAFAIGHLVRMSGFGIAGNNGLFRITTGSATVPAVGAGLLTDEAAPAAAARMKVVGFQGAAADIAAVADGLTSVALDFTTLGIVPGMWLKIGGAGAAFRFATEPNNKFARVAAVSAQKLTLDNLPGSWAADTGAGKTLRVFFGDQIKNGVAKRFGVIERGFMGQAVPSYIAQAGMLVNQTVFAITTGEKVTANYTFMGLTGTISTTSLDTTPDPATTNPIMAASANVGRISENGAAAAGPNFIRGIQITVNNNARTKEALRDDGKLGPVDINLGDCEVAVQMDTYFGSAGQYQAYLAGTPTNVACVIQKAGQATVFALPRVTRTDGAPSAGGKNQDVMLPFQAEATRDTLTGAHIIMDRLEYYED